MNFNKFLYNIIKYTVYLSLFTPLIVHRSFLFPFVVPKTIFFWATAEVIFFAWALLVIFDKKFRPPKNLLVFAVMIFLLAMLMASLRGVNWSQSMWGPIERMGGMLTFLHLGAYFFVLASMFKIEINRNLETNRNWEKIFGVAVFVGVLVAGFFLLGYFGRDNVWIYARQGSTLGNSSLMGSYLIFPAFIALYLFLSQKISAKFNKFQSIPEKFIEIKKPMKTNRNPEISRYSLVLKILYGLAFLFLSFVLFRSTAWGAFLAFLIGLILMFIFWLYTQKYRFLSFCKFLDSRVIAIILFILLIGVGSMAFFGLFWQNEIILGYLPDIFSSEGVKTTIYGRLTVWQIVWQGFKERPVLGWGPENFSEAFSRNYNPCLGLTRKCGGEILYDRAHNVVFDMMIFGGLAGLGAYLWMFGVAFYLITRNFADIKRKNAERDAEENAPYSMFYVPWLMPGIIGALLISYFIQNLMVFDMIGSYQMFFLALAFVASHNT